MIKIGYQGILNSNSEEAAKQFSNNLNEECLLLPLVSSFNVLDNVNNGNIDYGVVAYKNNTGGKVIESVQAIKFLNLTLVKEITLPIHHYLYVRDSNVLAKDIVAIASHPQALTQCKKNLETNYKNITLVKDEDTATAARKLKLELFSRFTAVLCRMNAGIDNSLHLLESNLEDRDDNTTTFRIYKK